MCVVQRIVGVCISTYIVCLFFLQGGMVIYRVNCSCHVSLDRKCLNQVCSNTQLLLVYIPFLTWMQGLHSFVVQSFIVQSFVVGAYFSYSSSQNFARRPLISGDVYLSHLQLPSSNISQGWRKLPNSSKFKCLSSKTLSVVLAQVKPQLCQLSPSHQGYKDALIFYTKHILRIQYYMVKLLAYATVNLQPKPIDVT